MVTAGRRHLEGGTGRLHEAEMYRQRYANPVYMDVAKKFVAYAREHGYSPAALAVAWTRTHPQITAPIIGARTLAQWREALQCLDIELSPEQRDEISALSVEPPSATDREPMDVFRKRGW